MLPKRAGLGCRQVAASTVVASRGSPASGAIERQKKNMSLLTRAGWRYARARLVGDSTAPGAHGRWQVRLRAKFRLSREPKLKVNVVYQRHARGPKQLLLYATRNAIASGCEGKQLLHAHMLLLGS